MKTIEVAAAVIKIKDEIFCAKRKDEGPLAKKWEFPGGKIEKGETLQQALKRELHEELGLNITIGNFITTVKHQYPSFKLIMHAFYCDVNTHEIQLNEHLDSKWLKKNNLLELDWAEADIPIVNIIIKSTYSEDCIN